MTDDERSPPGARHTFASLYRALCRRAARLQRHYCNLFKFWRACRDKRCRRHLRCCGDTSECLKSRIGEIPRHAQFLAREAVLVSTPHNAGGAERTVRQFMPRDIITPDPLQVAMNRWR